MRRTTRPGTPAPRQHPGNTTATPTTTGGTRKPHPARPTTRRRSDPIALLGRLTGRDHTLLRLLAEHRVLTTEHITRLLFPSQERAQRRLLTLYRYGALDRFRRPGLDDDPRTSWRYTLGPAGAAVLAAHRGTDPPHPATLAARLTRLAAHPQLEHLLGVNDLITTLAAHARTHPGYELALWWGERHTTEACDHLVRPDALTLWRHPGGETLLLIEHDTGTEPLARVADKLHAYRDLAAAGGPHLDRPTPGAFALLFHLPTLAREAHLRPLLETRHTTHTTPPAAGEVRMVVATSTAEFTHTAGPAADIWLPLHGHTRQRPEDLTSG
jgi:hypothetical protein